MSISTAIGKVSESLKRLLEEEMDLPLTIDVTVLSPNEIATDRRINLFLYKVEENPALKNSDWEVKKGEPNRIIPPPLSLNLFYLMTPYAKSDDPLTADILIHEILGEAMRVLYENPIIPSDYLSDDLQDTREEIKIIHHTLDLEELSKIWSTFSQPFRLSVLYEVSVVQLDMLSVREKPMPKRVSVIGRPEVRAPYEPPVVEKIEPINGPAGSTINFHGHGLLGWRVYVSIMGRQILNGIEITGDVFSMTIPADMPPGFHEIRVDISHLFKRIFFFEVT